MKKTINTILVLLFSITLFGCQDEVDTYQIPDLIGETINDAKLIINGEIRTETSFVETNEYLPNTVIGFCNDLEVGDIIKKNETLDIQVAANPEGS